MMTTFAGARRPRRRGTTIPADQQRRERAGEQAFHDRLAQRLFDGSASVTQLMPDDHTPCVISQLLTRWSACVDNTRHTDEAHTRVTRMRDSPVICPVRCPARIRRAPRTIERCPTASPERPARTCSSTRTTPSTGFPGGPTRWPGRSCSTGRSSCRSATRPATGATSWSASRSRTSDRRLPERPLRLDQGRPRGAAGPRPDLHGRRPGDDRRRRLADVRLPDARRAGRSTAARTSRTSRATGCRRSARCSKACRPRWRDAARRGRRRRAAAGRGARRAEPRGEPWRGRTRPPALLDAATAGIEASFDARNGGWGGAPKFPQPMTIEFLLRRIVATGDAAAAARWPGVPLDAMADGGHPRPARWRLPPLRDGRRAGSCRTSSRCSTTTPSSRASTSTPGRSTGDARYRAVGDGDARLHAPRADDRRRRVRREPGRRHRGRGGRDVHLAAAEIGEVLGDDCGALRGSSTA